MIALVSCFSNPFSPAMSARVLQPASNSSIKSFGFFIRSPSISEDRLHKMIYTLLGSATTVHGTVALSFVIPSEAEGSAVPRTFRGNAESYAQKELSSRPERSVVERSAVFFYLSRRL